MDFIRDQARVKLPFRQHFDELLVEVERHVVTDFRFSHHVVGVDGVAQLAPEEDEEIRNLCKTFSQKALLKDTLIGFV